MKNKLNAATATQPDRIAVFQVALFDSFAVDERAGRAAKIANLVCRPVQGDFGVITRDVRIVEREVVAFVATYAKNFPVQLLNSLFTIRVLVGKGGFLDHNSPLDAFSVR